MAEEWHPRKRMPHLVTLARYWEEHAASELPDNAVRLIGIGEPLCFRCGWLAPVPDYSWLLNRGGTAFRPDTFERCGQIYAQHPEWTGQQALRATWGAAARFLDRAHLADYCRSGNNDPANVIPLCHLCHRDMPEFAEREPALAWVAAGCERPWWWGHVTDACAQAGVLTSRHQLRDLYRRALETAMAAVEAGLIRTDRTRSRA